MLCVNNMKIVKTIIIILSLLILNSCYGSSTQGIYFFIRNRSTNEFLLKAKFSDQDGHILYDLSIPLVHTADNKDFTDKKLILDSQFDNFIVELKLISIPKAKIITELLGTWPGNAGTATNDGSNRIFVGVEITEKDGLIKMFFSGII